MRTIPQWATEILSAADEVSWRSIDIARDEEMVRLREALVVVRDAITSDLNAKSIVCTVWANPVETLVDYIDAALKEGA
ncbi:hypothetical protein HK25_06990 [Acetobacter sp. DsW_059]|nr:hypothetical protein HK25_06990 [Acetobacter sp. DsW_059]